MYLKFFPISISCSFDYSNNRIANSGGLTIYFYLVMFVILPYERAYTF